MQTQTDKNKQVILRFNKEVIEQGSLESFSELMDDAFINHSAPVGMDNGSQGMIYFFNTILRPGIAGLKVTIHQQVAEGNLVTTRKTISGTHTGPLMGIPATGQQISIDVIDIVEVKEGKYFGHWGITTFAEALGRLKAVQ